MAALAVAAQDTITLRRELKEGSAEKYKIESSLKQNIAIPGMGEQNMDITTVIEYGLTVGKVDAEKGVADAMTTTKIVKMLMEGMPGGSPEIPATPPVEAPIKLDNRNRMTIDPSKATGPGNPMMMLGGGASSIQTSGLFVEFPEGPVKVGDTWDLVVPKSPMMSKEDQKLKVTLVGEKDVDGVMAWVFKLEGTLKMEPDLEAMMKSMDTQGAQIPSMKISGTMELSSEGVVEKATGKTIRMTTKMKLANTMEMVEQGMKLDMTGSGTTKVSRL